MFEKDGHLLRILFESCEDDRDFEETFGDEEDRMFELEKIQTMLVVLEFGRAQEVYFFRQPDGSYTLVYRNAPTRAVSCRVWAPLVEEGDITIISWCTIFHRIGLWKGREVQLTMGCDEESMVEYIEGDSEGHRLFETLGLGDLTFPVLGHIVRDGCLVGLMAVPTSGRCVKLSDRAAVYQAVARIEERGLLHQDLRMAMISITDDGVRFPVLCEVRHRRKDDRFATDAAQFHWQKLEELFEDLENVDVYSQKDLQIPCPKAMPTRTIIIPKLPSLPSRRHVLDPGTFPACPPYISVLFGRMTRSEKVQFFEKFRALQEKAQSSRKSRNQSRVIEGGILEPRGGSGSTSSMVVSRPSHSHIVLHHSFHPYNRLPKASRRIILAPAEQDVASAKIVEVDGNEGEVDGGLGEYA